MTGWASKVRFANGAPVNQAKAHFLDEDGQPACAKLTHVSKERGLEPKRAPFTCSWGPHQAERDHVCRECVSLRDPSKLCRCGLCRIRSNATRQERTGT